MNFGPTRSPRESKDHPAGQRSSRGFPESPLPCDQRHERAGHRTGWWARGQGEGRLCTNVAISLFYVQFHTDGARQFRRVQCLLRTAETPPAKAGATYDLRLCGAIPACRPTSTSAWQRKDSFGLVAKVKGCRRNSWPRPQESAVQRLVPVRSFLTFGTNGRLRPVFRPGTACPWRGTNSIAAKIAMPWYATTFAGTHCLILDAAKSGKQNLRLDPHGTGN